MRTVINFILPRSAAKEKRLPIRPAVKSLTPASRRGSVRRVFASSSGRSGVKEFRCSSGRPRRRERERASSHLSRRRSRLARASTVVWLASTMILDRIAVARDDPRSSAMRPFHTLVQGARMVPTRRIGARTRLLRASRRCPRLTTQRTRHRFRVLSGFLSRITFDLSFSLTFTLSRPARRSLCTPFARFDRLFLQPLSSVPVCIILYTLLAMSLTLVLA